MEQETQTISKMETVETAVEWLVNNLPQRFKNIMLITGDKIIEQAKAMEKEQIIQAYHKGLFGNMELKGTVFADEYYKQTYNK